MFPHTDDINPVASTHVETIALLSKNFRTDNYVEIDVEAEDYYRIKESRK